MATSRPTPPWCWRRPPGRTRVRWPRPSPRRWRADKDIVKVDVAGPGFVNMKLVDGFWQTHLATILGRWTGLRPLDRSARAGKINVEYVSANPTGPMHVGHCRGAVVGDALANLLGFAGYAVTKEYVHQRRRLADRRARPLRLPALPRGARRGDRRDPARPLSRRLSRAGRPGAGRRFRPWPAADAGGRGAGHRQGPHGRRHDGR